MPVIPASQITFSVKKSTRALWTFMGWPTLLCLKVQSGKIIDTYISRPTFNEVQPISWLQFHTIDNSNSLGKQCLCMV